MLENNNDLRRVLNNVKYALDVCLNLIYMENFDDKGNFNTIGYVRLMLTKGSMIVVRDKRLHSITFMDFRASFLAAH